MIPLPRMLLLALPVFAALPPAAACQARPAERVNVMVQQVAFPEALQRLFESVEVPYTIAPREDGRPEPLPDRRVTLNVRGVPLDRALEMLFRMAGEEGLGWSYVRGDRGYRLGRMPVRSDRLELPAATPAVPKEEKAGPLRVTLRRVEVMGDLERRIRVEFDVAYPGDVQFAVGGARAGIAPSVRTKSGRLVRIQGPVRSQLEGGVRRAVLEGELETAPDDPPAALVWDVRWWKRPEPAPKGL